MIDKTFILKHNTKEDRQKIDAANIHLCVCSRFAGAVWLDYHTSVHNGVHGVGYGGGEMTDEEAMALFLHEVKNPVYFDDVDEFIKEILAFEKEMKEQQ